jgi:O-antigen ligase
LLAIVVFYPAGLIYSTFLLAFTALPVALSPTVAVGGYHVSPFEPLLLLSALYVFAYYRPPRTVLYVTIGFATLVIGWSLYGKLSGNGFSDIVREAKPGINLILGLLIAGGILHTDIARKCWKLLPWTLWVSAGFSVLASASGLELAGRIGEASLALPGDSSDASRLLTPATYLAAATLYIVLSLGITKRERPRDLLNVTIPAAIIVLLSFSRNHILGFGVAAVFAVLTIRNLRLLTTLIPRVVTTVLWTSLVVLLLVFSLSALPKSNWARAQADGYSGRVLEGLSSEARKDDPSVQFRVREDKLLVASFEKKPVLGHGLGYAYKPPEGKPGEFIHDQAPFYAHNYYLWLLVKVGILGLLIFLAVTLIPLLQVLRKPSTIGVAAGSCLAAFLAISFVAPLPGGTPTSLLFGAILGVLTASLSARRAVPVRNLVS